MRRLLFFFLPVIAFGQAAEDRTWSTLNQNLQNTNPAKRIDGLLAMSMMLPDAKVRGLVEAMLKDKDSGVRVAACSTLGEMKSRPSISKLQQVLDDATPEVSFAAAKTLYRMGDPLGRKVLIGVLVGDRSDTSGLLSTSMREVKMKLRDPKAMLLMGINSGAGLLGPIGMGVPVAERLMKDNQASGKTAAALLLATDTSEESKEAVRSALQDKNWTVRAAAARAIAIRDIKPFSSDLGVLLDDKRDEVRLAAAAAMIRLKQGSVR